MVLKGMNLENENKEEEREDLAAWQPGGGATKRRRDSEW